MLLKLLALPVTLPAAGIRFCLQQVLNAAEAELNDDAAVREALLLLSLKLEEGEISEEDFVAEEAVLMQRLRDIRARKDQQVRQQLVAQESQKSGPDRREGVIVGSGTPAHVVLEVAPEVPPVPRASRPSGTSAPAPPAAGTPRR
jgi:hypothetical protein